MGSSTSLINVRRWDKTVNEIVDGKKDVVIRVSKADCAGANRRELDRCAVARAACRSLHIDNALISGSTAFLIQDGRGERFIVPSSLRLKLLEFDRAGVFMPGDYLLKAPKGCQKIGYVRNQNGNGLPDRYETAGRVRKLPFKPRKRRRLIGIRRLV